MIFVACLIITISYLATLFIPEWLGMLGLKAVEAIAQAYKNQIRLE